MGNITKLDTPEATRDLRETLRAELAAAGLTVTQAAREIGRSHSTISRWLANKYAGRDEAVEALVERWLETRAERARRSLDGARLDRHAETGAAAEVATALGYAQAAADVVLIHGPSGRGKTWAAKRHCAGRSSAFYVAVSGATGTMPGLLAQVALAIGEVVERRTSSLEAETTIVNRLRDRTALLVVDEAHHLRTRLLDELRCIRDRAGCGLALIGDDSIFMPLGRAPQLIGRIGMKVNLRAQAESDVSEIAAGPLGRPPTAKEIKMLLATARGPGGLHALRRLLARAWMAAEGDGRSTIETANIALAADDTIAAAEEAA